MATISIEQATAAPRLTYRPDVDGLRAIAVLLVVFDHLATRVTGGYIGVDVFFVISGYLISSVILSEMSSGHFSVVNFYERRIRRIFPALLAMLLGSACLAFTFLGPADIVAFARSLVAALFSVSNFLFWSQANYFDTASAVKPLLHTWSLAVEEQFYIVFPLFLIAVRRWFPSRLRTAIWSAAALTFVLAWVCVQRDPTAAFFFAPLRAWELLIGTIISQRYVPAIRGQWARNLAAASGLLLIIVPALRYTAWTTFPGPAALPPCLGAALLIAAGETGPSLAGRLLSWRPVAFIGLISYSLYLWHWPILVFQKSSFIRISEVKGAWQDKLAAFVISLIVATISWRFVERPFRTGKFRPNRRTLFWVVGSAAAATAALGVIMITAQGFPGRFPPEALAADRYTDYNFSAAFRTNICFIDPVTGSGSFAGFNKSVCLADDPKRKHYLLMGDSHAAQLHPGLAAVFPELNVSQATTAGCRPLFTQPEYAGKYCGQMWNYIYGDYLSHSHVDVVILSARWFESDVPELNRVMSWMQQKGIEVIFFGPSIEFDAPLPRLIALALRDRNPGRIEKHFATQAMELDKKLQQIAVNQWKVRYVSEFDNLCNPGMASQIQSDLWTSTGCPVYAAPGVPLLFDADHLTPQASILFAKSLRNRHQLP